MTSRLPKLVAFDLDYTLWDLWIDTHVTPPLARNGRDMNCVTDKYGQEIALYPDVGKILHRLRAAGTTVAACSRTSAPSLARQALDLLLVQPTHTEMKIMRAAEFFDQMEIYPGSKITHFKHLNKVTNIPYEEMLFFDDEYRNKEVSSLGVTFSHTPNGLDNAMFEKGLAEWRKRNPTQVVEDAASEY